jgi:hypothetical protein
VHTGTPPVGRRINPAFRSSYHSRSPGANKNRFA